MLQTLSKEQEVREMGEKDVPTEHHTEIYQC